ncbi:MAG: ion transporter [Pirellulales bacterium]
MDLQPLNRTIHTDHSTGLRRFEIASQLLVVYSIVVFYVESELTAPGAARLASGFWLWNERAVIGLFCLEYLWRWYFSSDRRRYPFTFLALVDMLAIAPSLIGLAVNARSLKLLRMLPLLWMFKLYRYHRALQVVVQSFRNVRHELAVVGFAVGMVALFSATAIHEFERDAQPEKFGRLSDGLWWALVTLTTVGYGDLYPVTGWGRLVAAITMVVGIGILGTFISLIGSSLVTTMNDERKSAAETEETLKTVTLSRDQLHGPWTQRRAG